jgi:surface antigen
MLSAALTVVATMALAVPQSAEAAMQCVTYARDASGLNLKGDAWRWWDAAAGVYERGTAPREGAVLVFKRQGRMSHGHVSVVRRTLNSREVLVDHANWAPHRSPGRGQIAEAVPVIDVSPRNDWSQVRVFYRPAGELGTRVYLTQGFVYRPGASSRRALLPQPVSLAPAAPAAVEPAPAPRVEPVAVEAAAPVHPVATLPVVAAPAAPPAPVRTAPPAPVKTAAPAPAPTTPVAPAVVPAAPSRVDVSRWAEQA